MISLLEQAVAELEKLSEEEQDAIAARILAEIEDERAWAARFAATSGAQWAKMVALAQQEIEAGETVPLDDVLPALQS